MTKEELACMNMAQVCSMFRVDRRTIQKWAKSEDDPFPYFEVGKGRGSPSKFDPQEVLQWALRQEMSKVVTTEDGEYIDSEYQKARLVKEQADKESLMNAQRRRETAPIDYLNWALNKVSSQIASILAAVPLKVKRRIPDLSATEIDLIKKEIVVAQNAASRITIDLDDYSASH